MSEFKILSWVKSCCGDKLHALILYFGSSCFSCRFTFVRHVSKYGESFKSFVHICLFYSFCFYFIYYFSEIVCGKHLVKLFSSQSLSKSTRLILYSHYYLDNMIKQTPSHSHHLCLIKHNMWTDIWRRQRWSSCPEILLVFARWSKCPSFTSSTYKKYSEHTESIQLEVLNLTILGFFMKLSTAWLIHVIVLSANLHPDSVNDILSF